MTIKLEWEVERLVFISEHTDAGYKIKQLSTEGNKATK